MGVCKELNFINPIAVRFFFVYFIFFLFFVRLLVLFDSFIFAQRENKENLITYNNKIRDKETDFCSE